MIPRQSFGRTGHESSRAVFGAYALSQATEEEADRTLELLLSHGVNHIDTAPMYGNAEKLIGSWMTDHRERFFLATKTRKRGREGAWADLCRSLETLRVDTIDLWQLHGLTGEQGRVKALRPGGALEAMVEAHDQGLVRFLGVTGHTPWAPERHLASLEAFDFESVMVSYNHAFMQTRRYASKFQELERVCDHQQIALQTIKAVARRPWGEGARTHNTYFYEPLTEQWAIDRAVHWVLGHPSAFLLTAGDLEILPRVLHAAERFETRPSDDQMASMTANLGIEPIFK